MNLINKIKPFLLRLVGPILLAVILLKIDLPTLWIQILETNIYYYFFAFVIVFGAISVRILRWINVVKYFGKSIHFIDGFRITMIGNGFNAIMPGRIGLEVIRFMYLKRFKIKAITAVSIVLITKIYEIAVYIICAIIGGFVFFPELMCTWQNSIVIAIMLIAIIRYKDKVILFLARIFAKNDIDKDMFEKIVNEHFFKPSKYIFSLFLLSVLATIATGSVLFVLIRAMGIETIPYWYVIWVSAIMKIITFVPISFLGVGTRDMVLISLLGVYNISQESAVSISLLFCSLLIFVALIGSVIAIVHGNSYVENNKKYS